MPANPDLRSLEMRRVEVDRMLREAGWRPGRRVDDERLAAWRLSLEAAGHFVMHPAAEVALREFGGLRIGRVEPGVDLARSDLHLDPTLGQCEEDRLLDRFPEVRGLLLFPLGEVHSGNAFLAIAASGEVVMLMDEIFGRWPSFEVALESLLLGIRA